MPEAHTSCYPVTVLTKAQCAVRVLVWEGLLWVRMLGRKTLASYSIRYADMLVKLMEV